LLGGNLFATHISQILGFRVKIRNPFANGAKIQRKVYQSQFCNQLANLAKSRRKD